MGDSCHSFEDIYEEYFNDVYQYILYFSNSKTDAEDLTQDTFVKVMKNLNSFNDNSSLKTWIFSIAKHTCLDYYRKKKLLSILPMFLANTQRSENGNPDKKIILYSEWEVLQKALTELKPEFRNVIILRGLKEFSIKETAEILNWKESKVKTNYFRAMQKLKNLVAVKEVTYDEQEVK